MGELPTMLQRGNGETSIYVIDENFQIIYSNEEIRALVSGAESGKCCYEILCHEHSQCRECPLRKENKGKSIVFHKQRDELVSVSTAPVKWPGAGQCYLVVVEGIKESKENQWDKEHFFASVEEAVRNTSDTVSWCMLSIDIENLKLFNEWYGRQAGDKLLLGIADGIKKLQETRNMIAGYFGDDNFALLMPNDQDQIEAVYDMICNLLDAYSNKTGFLPAIGIYEIKDREESVYSMYDRAEIARVSVKGNYTKRMKRFDSKMLEEMESGYVLYSDIRKALQEKEFTFYLQPKCNMENGKVIGAEALVRWLSKEKGMISPGVFIPFLENTGFIAELDPYIWEEVCKWQRYILDRGVEAVPISVNVSRVDMYSMDVPKLLLGLIQKYNLDTKLIEVEITESTFTEDNDFINHVITTLRQEGFRVLMDDFGSGYSSLNMLKDVEIDVLKIDMRFLDINDNNASKGIGILEAVLNMARLLGIGIIVEGVETEEQKQFLLKMGSGYGQGFYFYRPLPVTDFEGLIENNDNLDNEGFRDKKIEKLYLKDLLNEDMFSEVMINNMLGAVAFYDVHEDEISIVRYNENYALLLEHMGVTAEKSVKLREYFTEEDYQKAHEIFMKARKNRAEGAEGDIRRMDVDGTYSWFHIRAFFLREQDGHKIFYASVGDATDVYQKNDVLIQQNTELEFLNNDMPGGYYRHENNADCDFIYISKRFLEIFGFKREEIKEQFDDKFINMLHPDDRALLLQSVEAMKENGGNYSQPYRMRSKNGYILVMDQSRLVEYEGKEFFQGLILCDMDYYRQINDRTGVQDAVNDTAAFMPCGVFQYEADGNQEFSYVSSSMLAMLGYTRQGFKDKFENSFKNMVYEGDRERIAKEIKKQIQNSNYDSCEYRIEMADGSLKWVYDRGRIITDSTGKRWFYVAIMDYDYLKEKYREKEWQQMKYQSLAAIPGMIVFDYEPHLDRLTIEAATKEHGIKTMVADDFVGKIEEQEWLFKEDIDAQKKIISEALKRPMNGTVEFRGCFAEDTDFKWYRSYFKSLEDENGNVYRLVGRADNIETEIYNLLKWQDSIMRDSLTGLLDSSAARNAVNELVKQSGGGTMFIMDFDNFRGINDTLGYSKGDEFLKKVADILRNLFHKEDILARFGGDEFMICLPGNASKEMIVEKVKLLLLEMQEDSICEEIGVRCSVGIATTCKEDATFETLIHQADRALYQAKSEGKDRYVMIEDC